MTANTEPTAAGSDTATTNVWGVRADGGEYTDHLVRGGYVAYGGIDWPNMSSCETRADICNKLKQVESLKGKSKAGLAAYVGMMARFLWDIQAGDWVITPENDRLRLRYGEVLPGDYWYEPNAPDDCPYPMRRKIKWSGQVLELTDLPRCLENTPLKNTLKFTQMTVFAVKHNRDFLAAIGRSQ